MTDKERNPLTFVAKGLTDVKEGIASILTGPEHSSHLMYANGALDAMINRFHFLGGSLPAANPVTQFPPVTNFMGEELVLPKPIKAEDLSPDELETELFRDKVERLYATIQSIPADGLLNTYTLPEDQLVIRGVAKRAGLEGYEDREITFGFIDDIAGAIKKKEAKSAQENEIEKELAGQTKYAELHPKLQDAISTGERLAADLTKANEELADANTESKKAKAQKKVDSLQVDVEANVELQLKLEDEIKKLNLKS
jgi:hypothetical protein